jgi:IclR family KDG regulon transcriptional repressor
MEPMVISSSVSRNRVVMSETTIADTELAGGSLERLVAILDACAGFHHGSPHTSDLNPVGVADLSRVLGLSKGTVSRYLRRLEEAGVLQRLPDRRYVLGSRVYDWGQAATPGSDVRPWARPVMAQLAAAFGETVSLFVLLPKRGEAVCVDQVDGRYPIRLSAAVGRHLPLHVGASPRLLLAFAPDEVRAAFLARSSYPALASASITDAAVLRRALADTRRLGYVLSQDESNEGAVGVAAPIRDAAGTARAALSVAGPAGRIADARRDEIIAGVVRAADAVSHALGYRPSHGADAG